MGRNKKRKKERHQEYEESEIHLRHSSDDDAQAASETDVELDCDDPLETDDDNFQKVKRLKHLHKSAHKHLKHKSKHLKKHKLHKHHKHKKHYKSSVSGGKKYKHKEKHIDKECLEASSHQKGSSSNSSEESSDETPWNLQQTAGPSGMQRELLKVEPEVKQPKLEPEEHLKPKPEEWVQKPSLVKEKSAKQKTPSKAEGAKRTAHKAEALDFNFDFTKHKHSLGKIFLRDNYFSSIATRHSKDHDDFWAFVTRYQAFQRKKAELAKGQGQAQSDQDYDVRDRVNISLLCKDFDIFMKRGRLVDFEVERELSPDRVLQFKHILLHFLDFQQKQKFQKLHKIRRDQHNLPIFQYKKHIIEMLKQNQVIVVAGDTGCGKSTQVPQYLLEAGYSQIACTQPRRIACISLSKRVGYETLNEYGSQVAYQVRFEKSKTSATKILFLTEGLLLRQMSSDPLLEKYSVVVIDEVHERHIFTDFLLGILKCVLLKRSDLKLVLMSATINIHLFSDYFNKAPVIKVPGRLYPIELEYCPIVKADVEDRRRIDPTPYLRIMQRIDQKYPASERGDLLIFLSGLTEIMTVVEAAQAYGRQVKRWIVLPLHSSLSVEEQDKVFDIAPEGVRKAIVSTNIAETSVTIDGVRFIIDSGKVKIKMFDPKFKMEKLQEFWISRASSEQRKGRAGRTGPGVCFRLYDETDYNQFEEYSPPEMQRLSLDSLILQMISMGLPDARKFPFIEAPSLSSLETAISYLKEQGALTPEETLTPIGQMLSMLPVDVVLGKMLIMGSIFNMIDPVLSITAAMTVQSPFTNKAFADREAITARKPLESNHGDPLTLLNAFDEWIQVKSHGQNTRGWSRRRGLEEQRFYEMTKLKRQFKDLLRDHHLLDQDREGRGQGHMTSEQRRVQHGERKRLANLRREQQRERKKRKVLSVDDDDYKISDEDQELNEGGDIKDLEFRLSNDLSQLQETSNRSRSFTLRDINLMKIILCSGLYPQVAIADECNSYKMDSEQVYHTKNKPFVLTHPNSIFTAQPDILRPKDASGKAPNPSDLKGLQSSQHELLAYVSLLETNNKPYLVNLMRVPALQTVTLFSTSIDTNVDCTRLVCDGWLEFKFESVEVAEMVVSSIMQLRSTWHALLKIRLQDTFEGIEEERHVSPRARRLEHLLAGKLTEYLNSDIVYSFRRVLPAEMDRIYIGPGKGSTDVSKFKTDERVREDPVKGGARVTDYLTFNCLHDESTASVWGEFTANMQRHWTCPQCGVALIVSVLDRLQHEALCSLEEGKGLKTQVDAVEEKEREKSAGSLRKAYFCDECQQQLMLTTVEILKHRKSHVT